MPDQHIRNILDGLANIRNLVSDDEWRTTLEQASAAIWQFSAIGAWKSMEQWKAGGPANGANMLVLLENGSRVVAQFNGFSQSWSCDSGPIAWCEIPDVPQELIKRNLYIERDAQRLRTLKHARLGTKFPGFPEE